MSHTFQPEQNPLKLSHIQEAYQRIGPYLHKTPLLASQHISELIGHQVYFKCEHLQKTGAFKARGALNALLSLKSTHPHIQKIVSYSSGNHAQAIAWASHQLGFHAEIYMPEFVSPMKLKSTQSYGAKVILCPTRQIAEDQAHNKVQQDPHATIIPPYDDDRVICGQGTAMLEAFEQVSELNIQLDAVFTPCGGGGLLSGTTLAAKSLKSNLEVYGVEPITANDAAQSYDSGKLFRWKDSPPTIADGVQTLGLSDRTFHYVRQCNGIQTATEQEIIKWTQIIFNYLKQLVEPTASLGLAAANNWGKTQSSSKNILVLLSGGNMSLETLQKVASTKF